MVDHLRVAFRALFVHARNNASCQVEPGISASPPWHHNATPTRNAVAHLPCAAWPGVIAFTGAVAGAASVGLAGLGISMVENGWLCK
jgi:hypothetical protein